MKWKAVTADIFEKDPRANYFIVAAAVLLVFGQAISYDFVWDDFLFIVNNESIRSFSSIPSFFTHGSEDLYRPLRSVLFSLAYFLFGLNPAPYHIMGLVFHIAASFLVMRILEYCGFKPRQVLFGGLVFALHPVHIQKFIMITPVFDLAGDLFLLGATVSYLGFRRGDFPRGLGVSIFLFAVGLLFSEIVAPFPFLALMFELLFDRLPKLSASQRRFYWISLFLILITYLLVRTAVLGQIQRPHHEFNLVALYMSMMPVFLYYFRLLIVPYPLCPDPPLKIFINQPFNELTVISLIIVAAIIALAWLSGKREKLVPVAVFWFFLAILPNSNIIPTGTLMAERYLYLPSVGFSILAALFISRPSETRSRIAAGFLIYLAALSFLQAPAWKNEETLWETTLQLKPRSEIALTNLGKAYYDNGKVAEAKKVFNRMLNTGVNQKYALSQLAAVAITEGKYRYAETLLKVLDRLPPYSKQFDMNFLIVGCQLNRPGWREKADVMLKKYPTPYLYEEVGNCYAKWGEKEQALEKFHEALKLAPGRAKVAEKIKILETSPD